MNISVLSLSETIELYKSRGSFYVYWSQYLGTRQRQQVQGPTQKHKERIGMLQSCVKYRQVTLQLFIKRNNGLPWGIHRWRAASTARCARRVAVKSCLTGSLKSPRATSKQLHISVYKNEQWSIRLLYTTWKRTLRNADVCDDNPLHAGKFCIGYRWEERCPVCLRMSVTFRKTSH